MDEELLQEFLTEAGELIDLLDEQLVELEGTPDDSALLNSVFRAFHTIKGGAGFLGLTVLVELCHRAEDVLNLIRSGERVLDPGTMDCILQSLDEVKRMFAEIRAGQVPAAAPGALLQSLEALRDGAAAAPAGIVPAAAMPCAEADVARPAEAPAAAAQPDTITDDEFEALLDRMQARESAAAPLAGANGNAPDPVCQPAPADPPAGAAAAAPSAAGNRESARTAAVPPGEASLRVEAARIDEIMNQVGELVLVRNRLAALRVRIADDEVARTLSQLNLLTSDLQASVMRLRMQPVAKIFGRFSRVVRDLARQLGKEIDLVTIGENTELDKSMVESLADPLVHLVRNAVDHGVESPAEREQAGKAARGRVTLTALQEGSHILITVADDGAGLDPDRIRAKAVEKGLLDAQIAQQMADDEALQLVFLPGLSTKSAVSDVSGRGVGMDVVKSQIGRVNGTVEIRSERGRGSQVLIKLPLTLAIMPTLMVLVQGRQFALPLSAVQEVLDWDAGQRVVMNGREAFSLRGEVLPLLDLQYWVRPGAGHSGEVPRSVVIAVVEGRRVGLVVDGLIGQEEVVIKSLGTRLADLPGFAGVTITGDGDIALIVDVAGLHAHWQTLGAAGGRAGHGEAGPAADLVLPATG